MEAWSGWSFLVGVAVGGGLVLLGESLNFIRKER